MTREAWVTIPSEETVRAALPPSAKYPYDFGFLPAMGRLIRIHPRIGAAWFPLFREMMWSPDGVLSRPEREMIAAVAAVMVQFGISGSVLINLWQLAANSACITGIVNAFGSSVAGWP